jgi:hypothetical protein
MTSRNLVVGAVVLGLAVVAMRMFGLSFSDLVRLAKEEVTQARTDTKALMSGEYTERVARKLRDEAANLTSADPKPGDDLDSDLNRELAAERKRMLEERAQAVQEHAGEILRGDVETLKRQVGKRTREAGGDR